MAGLQTNVRDAGLPAVFYKKAIKHEFESQKQGREIYVDVDFVKIMIPGDIATELDQPVREDHKKRWPKQWAHYANNMAGDQREIGTPLAEWPRLTPAMVEELKALKFFTVDSIANASDAQLGSIQMIVGMSPFKLREHAQRFMKIANEDAHIVETDDKTKKLEAELSENKQSLKALQDQLAALTNALQTKPAGKRRGPKPKVKEADKE